MKPTVVPGEDPADLILYINENKEKEPYYGLDMLMLVNREDHYYVYSESGWITALSVSDVKESYQLLDDDYFVHHTILEFEEELEKDYNLKFPYSLIYNTGLMAFMIRSEDQETLEKTQAIYDRLIAEEEQLIAAQMANSSDLKRTISFYRWKMLILSEMNQQSPAEEVQRILELLSQIGDDHDAFTAESYEIAGDHYAYEKDYRQAEACFDQAFNILTSFEPKDTGQVISQIVIREKLGDVQNHRGHSPEALASYQFAIEHLRALKSDDEDLMIQLAALYQDAGRVFEDMRQNGKAGQCYKKEIEVLDQIANLYRSKENEHNYIIGLHNMASFMVRNKCPKAALSYYHQCLNVAYAYELKYSHAELSLLLAELYLEIGRVYVDTNNPDQMETGYDYLRKNMEIHKKRFEQSRLEGQGLSYGLSVGELKNAYEKAADERVYETASLQMAVFDTLYQYYPDHLNYRNHLKIHRAYAKLLNKSRNADYIAQAISLLESDVTEARQHESIDSDYQEDLVQSLYCLGSVYKDLAGTFYQDRGMEYLREALLKSHDDEMKNLCGEAIARIDLQRGGVYTHQALVLYQDILERSRFMDEYDVGHAYENLAYYYQVTGDEERCLCYHQKELSVFKTLYETAGYDHDYYNYVIAFRQTLDACLRFLSKDQRKQMVSLVTDLDDQADHFASDSRLDDQQIGSLLEQVGQVYYYLGENYYDRVSQLFDRAYIYLNKYENRQLVQLEERRGNIDELRQRYDEAYDHYHHQYQMACKLYRGDQDSGGLREVIAGIHNIGMVQYARHRYDESQKALHQELQYRIRLYHRGEKKQRMKIGLCHRYIGENRQAVKDYHGALTQYKIYHYFMPKESRQAAVAMEKIGNIYRLENTREGYLLARQCYRDVYDFIKARHNDESLTMIIHKLAYVCFKLGNAYAAEALKLYQEQSAIFKKLADEDQKYLGEYGVSLYNQGVILKGRDQMQSLTVFREAINIFKNVRKTPMIDFRLGNIYRLMGDLLGKADYYNKAIDYFKQSGMKEIQPYLATCYKALAGLSDSKNYS